MATARPMMQYCILPLPTDNSVYSVICFFIIYYKFPKFLYPKNALYSAILKVEYTSAILTSAFKIADC